MGEVESAISPSAPQQSPGLHLLRGMLQELNNPSLGGGIILLILRFASELMNRAVILLVKDEEIVGLGQFGIELEGESADVRVRNTRLPKAKEHVSPKLWNYFHLITKSRSKQSGMITSSITWVVNVLWMFSSGP